MINWILGGLIIGLTVYFIFKHIKKLKKGGGCSCECGGCDTDSCSSQK